MAKIAASYVFFSYVSLSAGVSEPLACSDVDDQAACEMETTLLQTKTEMFDTKRFHIDSEAKSSQDNEEAERRGDEAAQAAPEISERMQAALPVRMFHAPKCGGTSFFNAMFSLPGVCNGDEPPVYHGQRGDAADLLLILPHCPGFSYEIAGHPCLAPHLPEDSGRVFGMFRQPEQRLLSLHNYAQRESERQPGSPFAFPADDPLEFFENARGGMVYQLTHDDPETYFCTGHTAEYADVTDEDVAEAVRTINEDFAFVGIVEQWDLSICLLHAMFGGECTAAEFEDNNPGVDLETGEYAEITEYDVSVLNGAVDEPDRVLYEEALRIFERNLEEFAVTPESCREGCWARVRR